MSPQAPSLNHLPPPQSERVVETAGSVRAVDGMRLGEPRRMGRGTAIRTSGIGEEAPGLVGGDVLDVTEAHRRDRSRSRGFPQGNGWRAKRPLMLSGACSGPGGLTSREDDGRADRG